MNECLTRLLLRSLHRLRLQCYYLPFTASTTRIGVNSRTPVLRIVTISPSTGRLYSSLHRLTNLAQMEPSSYIPRYVQYTPTELQKMKDKNSEGRSREVSMPYPDFATPEFLSKPHINAALKHMPDEESKVKMLEGLPERKKMFDDPKFAATMAKLRAFKAEDPLRIETKRHTAPPPITTATRPRLKPSTSAPPAPLPDLDDLALNLPRDQTVSNLLEGLPGRNRGISVSREPWTAVHRGPVTPLSPTPMGNSFASGGFWEKSSPLVEPRTPTASTPPTPLTAMPMSPMSPIVPTEAHSREVYNEIHRDIFNLARTICARRLSAQGSSISHERGSFPTSMILPKDNLVAAEIVLANVKRGVRGPDPGLPFKLQELAEEEAKTNEMYSLEGAELDNVENWLQIDPDTKEMTTIVDAQRGFARMNRHRRKSGLIDVSEQALRMVWATRILEDAERAVEAQGDADSDVDQGYDYNNFLRSIKREVSSGSELSSMLGDIHLGEAATSRSRATTVGISSLSREVTDISEPSSGSPSRVSRGSRRSKEALAGNRKSWEERLSLTAASKGLSFITSDIEEETDDLDAHTDHMHELVLPNKVTRRMGASHLDLDRWAEELKNLQDSGSSIGDAESVQLSIHPALRTSWRNSMEVPDSSESFDTTSAGHNKDPPASSSFEAQQSFTHLISVFPAPPNIENTVPPPTARLARLDDVPQGKS